MIQVYTDHEFREIMYDTCSDSGYVEDETGDRHYIGDFERVLNGDALYGSWHGYKADSLGTGVVTYLHSDGDSALLGTYVVSGEM